MPPAIAGAGVVLLDVAGFHLPCGIIARLLTSRPGQGAHYRELIRNSTVDGEDPIPAHIWGFQVLPLQKGEYVPMVGVGEALGREFEYPNHFIEAKRA